MKDTKVHNFSLVPHPTACVNAYSKECYGCQSVGADIMLTFGSEITPLGGNNQPLEVEPLKHVDVFLTKKQAEHLHAQLTKVLLDNCFAKPKT